MNCTKLRIAQENEVLAHVVFKNNTLGYLFNEGKLLMMGVHGRITFNGSLGLDWFNGPVVISETDEDSIRVASKDDFNTFRVSHKGHLKD